MPNKIDTVNIVRDRENEAQNDVKSESNADYVTQLDKTSSIMPPEKPFEKEVANQKSNVKEENHDNKAELYVQNSKESITEIERSDQTTETKLHLLNMEYSKITGILAQGNHSAKKQASLRSLMKFLEDKLKLFTSKKRAGGKITPHALPIEVEENPDENN